MTRRGRLERLERLVPPAPQPEDPGWRRRWGRVLDRWERLVLRAEALMDGGQQALLTAALRDRSPGPGGPYAAWLRGLAEGRSRLPELPPQAMRDLLLAWLSPEADGGMVCRGCGLEYPRHKTPPLGKWKALPGKVPCQGPPPWYDLPALFPACPGCGGPALEADWPQHTGSLPRPWKSLDGYAGPVG